jgi:two-component system nitrate/nitrite response regulator NarP
MSNTKVLIADDHPIVLSGIEALLRDTSYEIVAKAKDGTSVLELVPAYRPDILLLDVDMPGRSGVDVLRALRTRGDQRPIVLLTASIDSTRAIEAIQLGVNGLVLKETAAELLLNCLDAVKGGGRWIDRNVLQQALDSALNEDETGGSALGSLTPKERAVVSLVAQGQRNREIASELGVTEGTVKVHLHKIYEKLKVANRTELAILANKVRA